MPIDQVVLRGVGSAPGSTKFIVTHGFLAAAAAATAGQPPQMFGESQGNEGHWYRLVEVLWLMMLLRIL